MAQAHCRARRSSTDDRALVQDIGRAANPRAGTPPSAAGCGSIHSTARRGELVRGGGGCLPVPGRGWVLPEGLREIPVYQSLARRRPESVMSFAGGWLIADRDAYAAAAVADGACPLTWRQGVKHDAAAVMELDARRLFRAAQEPGGRDPRRRAGFRLSSLEGRRPGTRAQCGVSGTGCAGDTAADRRGHDGPGRPGSATLELSAGALNHLQQAKVVNLPRAAPIRDVRNRPI